MKSGKTADAAAAEYTIPAAYEGYTPNADQTKSNVAVIYKELAKQFARSNSKRSAPRPGSFEYGVCALFMRPGRGRLIRSAIVFKPSTLLGLHRALIIP